jgi:hypothetical protein
MQSQREVLAEQLEIPTEPPPSYTTRPAPLTGLVGISSVDQQVLDLETTLEQRRKGSLYLAPVTLAGQIDMVYLLCRGKSFVQSLLLDIPLRPTTHPSWGKFRGIRGVYSLANV